MKWILVSLLAVSLVGPEPCPTAPAGLAAQALDRAAQESSNWMRRYDRPATYDVLTEHVMMPMRDGVRLATTLYFPARSGAKATGPFPALLRRYMGDSRDPRAENSEGRYFASRGYIVAMQTMRGRPPSEGEEFYLYGRQAHDGADAVEWLASQPWSTGKVGTFGVSHAGVAQYSLVTESPRGLAAMVPAFAHSNYALWSMRTGGALELRYLNWSTGAATVGEEAAADPVVARAAREERARFEEYLSRPPFLFKFEPGRSALRHTPSYEDWLLSMVEHSEYPASDGFLTDPGLNLTLYYESMADVPTMHHSGWYDTYPRAKADNWRALDPIKDSPQWLLLGSWTHTSAFPAHSGDVEFGPEAEGDYNEVRLAWFDQWVRGIDTAIADDPPVKLFVMGGGDGRRTSEGRMYHGGFWRESDSFPLEETDYVEYYFHADGTLSPEAPT
jgi:putative CocE/NonD family hydrolase